MNNYLDLLKEKKFKEISSRTVYQTLLDIDNKRLNFPIHSNWECVYQESEKHFKKFRYIIFRQNKNDSRLIDIFVTKLLNKRKIDWKNNFLKIEIQHKIPVRNIEMVNNFILILNTL